MRDVRERRVRVDLVHPGVHAVDEAEDDRLEVAGQRREEVLPLLLGVELAARVLVVGEEVAPDDLGEVAGRRLPHELHLEEPVLRLGQADPVADIVERVGLQMRDAVRVARHPRADVARPPDGARHRRGADVCRADRAGGRRERDDERDGEERTGETHDDLLTARIEPPTGSARQAGIRHPQVESAPPARGQGSDRREPPRARRGAPDVPGTNDASVACTASSGPGFRSSSWPSP